MENQNKSSGSVSDDKVEQINTGQATESRTDTSAGKSHAVKQDGVVTRFKDEAKYLRKAALTSEEYRVRMRMMMKKYSDAEVLKDLQTLPVASYVAAFGQTFDDYYGKLKAPSNVQQSYNALASAWINDKDNAQLITEQNLAKLLSQMQGAQRKSGGVHIRNVQTGNLKFVSENLDLINIPANIRVVPERGWTTLIAVMLAKKLSEVLKQMREGEIDYQMAKSEVEALKAGEVVVRSAFGNMVTKMPNTNSRFALVLQHYAASYFEGGKLQTKFVAGLTFEEAKKSISADAVAAFTAEIKKLF